MKKNVNLSVERNLFVLQMIIWNSVSLQENKMIDCERIETFLFHEINFLKLTSIIEICILHFHSVWKNV